MNILRSAKYTNYQNKSRESEYQRWTRVLSEGCVKAWYDYEVFKADIEPPEGILPYSWLSRSDPSKPWSKHNFHWARPTGGIKFESTKQGKAKALQERIAEDAKMYKMNGSAM